MRCFEWATGCHHSVWGAGRFSGGAESHQMGESQLGGRGIPGSYGGTSEAGKHEATVLHKGFLLQRQTLIFRRGSHRHFSFIPSQCLYSAGSETDYCCCP